MVASRVKQAAVAERRRRCVELRTEGKTWDVIRDLLGYKTRGAACQDFGRALTRLIKDQNAAVDDLRALELERIDALWREAWGVLMRPHLLVQGGKPVQVEPPNGGDPVTLQDDGPKLTAIETLRRLSERRAKLIGIDAPVQIDVPGTVRVELVGVDPEVLR